MKTNRIFWYLIVVIILISCTETKKNTTSDKSSFKINGTINSISSTKAYLYKQNVVIDSAAIINNKFEFLGTTDTLQNYSVRFKNSDLVIKALIENTSYNLYASPTTQFIYGGFIQNQLNNYNDGLKAIKANNYAVLDSIIHSKKPHLLQSIDSLNSLLYTYNLTSIKKTNHTPIINIIFNNILNNSKLDTTQLKELVVLAESIDNKEWQSKFKSEQDKIVAIELKLKEEQKASNTTIAVKRRKAPSFSGLSINGSNLSLQSVLNGKKVVLIDFWASWCAPCRAASPKIRYLYQKYKHKGFDIITVSEDKNQNDWRNGISEDNMLAWNHIYDENMRIASKFYVGSIPHMVLIDENGGIIVDKISAYRLEGELKKIFK